MNDNKTLALIAAMILLSMCSCGAMITINSMHERKLISVERIAEYQFASTHRCAACHQ